MVDVTQHTDTTERQQDNIKKDFNTRGLNLRGHPRCVSVPHSFITVMKPQADQRMHRSLSLNLIQQICSMSPSILCLSITPSGQINSIFPWSHSPVVCRACDRTCRTGQEKFEAKSLTAALTERVSISYVIKLEFSFMKKVPLRWETI